ncbi:MAG: AraC family transcriptional regulator [Prevotella sp.]|nr:AraC family transcriptional regulator [Prevotella sp.]
MSLSRMRDIFGTQGEQLREHVFINSEIAIVQGDPLIFRLVMQQQPPFVIDDHRLGIITKGELIANFNLVEKRLTPGTLVFIGPGSILSPVSISPDAELYGIGLSPLFPMPFAPGQLPQAFNGQVRDFQLPADEADLVTARSIVDTIWQIVHQPDYNRQTVGALVAAQMHHYDRLFRQHEAQLEATRSREQTIFDRFIYLVNRHSQTEHHLQFYAAKMCLTERYLGTVVRQTSGTTAKAWIDRAIVMRVKAELRHTDKSAAQIADEMNFPNPSFFSKYFKRLTGLTPQDYKRQPV